MRVDLRREFIEELCYPAAMQCHLRERLPPWNFPRTPSSLAPSAIVQRTGCFAVSRLGGMIRSGSNSHTMPSSQPSRSLRLGGFRNSTSVSRAATTCCIDIVENRFVGLKSRGCRPHLHAAHIDLARGPSHGPRGASSTGPVRNVQTPGSSTTDKEREFLEDAIISSQKHVNGYVRCQVYKGAFTVVGCFFATKKLYDMFESSMDEIGEFTGFINVQAIRLKKYSKKEEMGERA